MRVIDENWRPVAPGEVGELYISGGGLARCYLNAPDLTAERFLPDPFSRIKGMRMYKTGDLVCARSDGTLDFIGRADDQIKVRGFRVEPGEIEVTLATHAHVRQARPRSIREIAPGNESLVGYVVAGAAPVTAAELVKHLKGRLPDHMVPSRFMFLDALPLTPSGKVDRRMLASLALPASTAKISAEDDLLEIVTGVWELVLGRRDFTVDDDFFDIGGDFLLATWAAEEISKMLGAAVDLSTLLDDATIAGMAKSLKKAQLETELGLRSDRVSDVVTLRAGSLQQPLFLVHPLGGELFAYKNLARLLRPPRMILGLHWHPIDAGAANMVSLQEMATTHLEQVRAVQPAGPYHFAGWSFGGVLAFEMAQQILASGERVDFLGMLDANPVLDPTSRNTDRRRHPARSVGRSPRRDRSQGGSRRGPRDTEATPAYWFRRQVIRKYHSGRRYRISFAAEPARNAGQHQGRHGLSLRLHTREKFICFSRRKPHRPPRTDW